ncbi:hypothetical protein [Hymenobacter sp. B81]|uniref:hypothetical protein n=1 Tax=Hymenobacter sp. B81 TaxID=3344878 RepID=UPI0037DD60E7
MRKYYYTLMLALLGCGESRRETATQQPQSAPEVPARPTAPPRPATGYAARPYIPLGQGIDSLNGAPVARIAGENYRVVVEARPDLTRPLLWSRGYADSLAQADPDWAKSIRESGYGFDATYTFKLLDARGRARFTTTLRKMDFAEVVAKELLMEAVLDTPVFYGYLPKFNALAYRSRFTAEGTDWSMETLLLLDAGTGRVRYLLPDKPSEDLHESNMLTPDGEVLITRQRLIHASGRQLALQRPDQRIAATQLISSNVVLVVYEPDFNDKGRRKPGEKLNARLLDLSGRELDRFAFRGTATDYLEGLALNHCYAPQLGSHYLFDDSNRTLRIIPARQPTASRLLSLESLPKYALPTRAAEVRLEIRTGLGEQLVLFADTVSGELRAQPVRQL